jgi:hypothetical protein
LFLYQFLSHLPLAGLCLSAVFRVPAEAVLLMVILAQQFD